MRYFGVSSGFAGVAGGGGDDFSLARDASTRFLKSPASLLSNPLKPDWITISQPSPFEFSATELMRFWPIAPIPMEYDADISVFSIDITPYFPEFRRVSFTAVHNVPHGMEYMSLCVLANEGTATLNNIRAATANRFMVDASS
jgi:hypothetical protein